MRITPKAIVGLIISLVMIMVLFSMLPSILPTVADATNDVFATTALGNETVVGSAPAAFAANVTSYLGWFWVLGPFILVIGLVVGLFLKRR